MEPQHLKTPNLQEEIFKEEQAAMSQPQTMEQGQLRINKSEQTYDEPLQHSTQSQADEYNYLQQLGVDARELQEIKQRERKLIRIVQMSQSQLQKMRNHSQTSQVNQSLDFQQSFTQPQRNSLTPEAFQNMTENKQMTVPNQGQLISNVGQEQKQTYPQQIQLSQEKRDESKGQEKITDNELNNINHTQNLSIIVQSVSQEDQIDKNGNIEQEHQDKQIVSDQRSLVSKQESPLESQQAEVQAEISQQSEPIIQTETQPSHVPIFEEVQETDQPQNIESSFQGQQIPLQSINKNQNGKDIAELINYPMSQLQEGDIKSCIEMVKDGLTSLLSEIKQSFGQSQASRRHQEGSFNNFQAVESINEQNKPQQTNNSLNHPILQHGETHFPQEHQNHLQSAQQLKHLLYTKYINLQFPLAKSQHYSPTPCHDNILQYMVHEENERDLPEYVRKLMESQEIANNVEGKFVEHQNKNNRQQKQSIVTQHQQNLRGLDNGYLQQQNERVTNEIIKINNNRKSSQEKSDNNQQKKTNSQQIQNLNNHSLKDDTTQKDGNSSVIIQNNIIDDRNVNFTNNQQQQNQQLLSSSEEQKVTYQASNKEKKVNNQQQQKQLSPVQIIKERNEITGVESGNSSETQNQQKQQKPATSQQELNDQAETQHNSITSSKSSQSQHSHPSPPLPSKPQSISSLQLNAARLFSTSGYNFSLLSKHNRETLTEEKYGEMLYIINLRTLRKIQLFLNKPLQQQQRDNGRLQQILAISPSKFQKIKQPLIFNQILTQDSHEWKVYKYFLLKTHIQEKNKRLENGFVPFQKQVVRKMYTRIVSFKVQGQDDIINQMSEERSESNSQKILLQRSENNPEGAGVIIEEEKQQVVNVVTRNVQNQQKKQSKTKTTIELIDDQDATRAQNQSQTTQNNNKMTVINKDSQIQILKNRIKQYHNTFSNSQGIGAGDVKGISVLKEKFQKLKNSRSEEKITVPQQNLSTSTQLNESTKRKPFTFPSPTIQQIQHTFLQLYVIHGGQLHVTYSELKSMYPGVFSNQISEEGKLSKSWFKSLLLSCCQQSFENLVTKLKGSSRKQWRDFGLRVQRLDKKNICRKIVVEGSNLLKQIKLCLIELITIKNKIKYPQLQQSTQSQLLQVTLRCIRGFYKMIQKSTKKQLLRGISLEQLMGGNGKNQDDVLIQSNQNISIMSSNAHYNNPVQKSFPEGFRQKLIQQIKTKTKPNYQPTAVTETQKSLTLNDKVDKVNEHKHKQKPTLGKDQKSQRFIKAVSQFHQHQQQRQALIQQAPRNPLQISDKRPLISAINSQNPTLRQQFRNTTGQGGIYDIGKLRKPQQEVNLIENSLQSAFNRADQLITLSKKRNFQQLSSSGNEQPYNKSDNLLVGSQPRKYLKPNIVPASMNPYAIQLQSKQKTMSEKSNSQQKQQPNRPLESMTSRQEKPLQPSQKFLGQNITKRTQPTGPKRILSWETPQQLSSKNSIKQINAPSQGQSIKHSNNIIEESLQNEVQVVVMQQLSNRNKKSSSLGNISSLFRSAVNPVNEAVEDSETGKKKGDSIWRGREEKVSINKNSINIQNRQLASQLPITPLIPQSTIHQQKPIPLSQQKPLITPPLPLPRPQSIAPSAIITQTISSLFEDFEKLNKRINTNQNQIEISEEDNANKDVVEL